MKTAQIIFTLCILTLFSCGKQTHRKYETVDPAFYDYESMFYEELEHYTGKSTYVNIAINFEEVPEGATGYCKIYEDHSKEIYIHKAKWETMTEIDRELLFFHEMGHCYLGKDHTTKFTIMHRIPTTIRVAYKTQRDLFLEYYFNNNQDAYAAIDFGWANVFKHF